MFKHSFAGWFSILGVAALWTLPLHEAWGQDSAARFSSAAKGNIFTAVSGEILLSISGTDAVTSGAVVVKDERGQVTGGQPIASGESRVTVPLPQKGFYQLSAEVSLGSGKKLHAEATAAVVGPLLDEAVRGQSRLGLWTVQGDKDLVLAAGARWNRAMATIKDLPQDFPQTGSAPALQAKPPFDISGFTYEGVISFGLPLWLVDPKPGEEHKGYSNPFQAPKDWDALAELVKAFTRCPPRWSEFPPYLEIYNEPEWHWKGTNEDLVRFEKTVADAVKAVRPDVKVLGPGFSSIRIKDAARLDLETVNRLGLLDHLDGLVLHAYVDGSAPEELFIQRIEELQAFLARIGRPDFPIHLTEFGWCTKPGTWQRPVDELTQAQYVTRSLTLLTALGVENATYFALLFKAAPNEGERSFSIVHDDLTPKPAYASYSNVARWLADVRGKGRWLRLTPTTHLVVFQKERKTVAVAWDTQAGCTIPLGSVFARAEEMTGRPVPVASGAGVNVSPSPVFLELKDSGLYQAKELPAVRLMRGTSAELPQAPGAEWITPAPLSVKGRTVSAPRTARQGSYLVLSHSDAAWTSLPVEVVAPVEISAARIVWPLSAKAPEIALGVTSHAEAPLSVLASAKFDKIRRMFGEPVKAAPASGTEVTIPVEDFVPGKRYKGLLTVESRENGERDETRQPLDFTVVSAQRVAADGRPDWGSVPAIDFSAWDPFGGPSEPSDCSATFQASYGPKALYLRICVRDDQHLQTRSPENLFNQDSIQIGLDADAEKTWEANDLFGLKGHRVFEYGAAWDGTKSMNWRWISYTPELPVGVSEPRMGTEIHRKGDLTEYLLTFPWEILGLKEAPRPGSAIGIALAVTDADPGKNGRRGLRLFNGITDEKDPQKYGKLWLR